MTFSYERNETEPMEEEEEELLLLLSSLTLLFDKLFVLVLQYVPSLLETRSLT